MDNFVFHANGGSNVIEVFSCDECKELQERIPVTISGWNQRFCTLTCAKDFFHNFRARLKYAN